MSALPPPSEPPREPPDSSALPVVPPPPPPPPPPLATASRVTLGVTNLLRLLGAIIAGNELLLHYSTLRPIALAVAALLIAGGNVSETLVLKLLDRLLGGSS